MNRMSWRTGCLSTRGIHLNAAVISNRLFESAGGARWPGGLLQLSNFVASGSLLLGVH